MALDDLGLSLMAFPQRWGGGAIAVNLLILPFGDPTAPLGGGPAFAGTTVHLVANVIAGLEDLPTSTTAPALSQPVVAQPPPVATPLSGPKDPTPSNIPPAVIQVRCPACQMNTMATAGQPSVCFSCGQPLPVELTKGGGGVNAPGFPPTGALNAAPLVAPPNPYGPAPAAGAATAATIRGQSGQFTVRSGSEVRVGRDPAQCPIFLSEPRVSGVHATLKFEAGFLQVRDETSNNGTFVAGNRIPPSVWTPVPAGTPLKFGPIEFAVQLEP